MTCPATTPLPDLLAKLDPALPTYALVHMGLLPRPTHWLRQWSGLGGICLCDSKDAALVAPWLYRLPIATLDRRCPWPTLHALSAQHHCVIWLQSSLPPAALASRLRARQCCDFDGLRVLLNFHDPLTLGFIVPLLSPGQRGQLLAVAQRWLYLDGDGALHIQTLPAPDALDVAQPELRFNAEQADQILDFAELGQLVAHTNDHAPPAWLSYPLGTRYRLARQQRAQAQGAGQTRMGDYVEQLARHLAGAAQAER